MRSPPKPTHSMSGRSCRRQRIRLAPCRSPLGSPALIKMRMGFLPSARGRQRSAPRADRRCPFYLILRRWPRAVCADDSAPQPHGSRPEMLRSLRLDGGAILERQAGQLGRLGDLAVAERMEHFQHLAPRRERSAIVPLVLVHRLHEDDFVVSVVALAGGRINLPAAL